MRTFLTAAIGLMGLAAGLALGQPVPYNPRTRVMNGRSSVVGYGVIEEDPQQIRQQMGDRCAHYLQLARAALAEGKLAATRRNLDMAAGLAVTPALGRQVQDLRLQFDQLGADLLVQAESHYAAGDYPTALRTYQVVAVSLGQLPTGLLARARLEAAERDPAVRSAVRETKAAALYQTIEGLLQAQWRAEQPAPAQPGPEDPLTDPLAQPAPADADDPLADVEPLEASWIAGEPPDPTQAARPADLELIARMPLDRQIRTVELLEKVVELYGDTSTGARAEGLLADLRNNGPLMQALQDRRNERVVQGLYEKARLYHTNGLHEKAAELYEQFLQEHPESPWSDQARQGLAEVRAKIRPKPRGAR